MPAGPIGSVWGTGTWSDTAWEAGTWADVGAAVSIGFYMDLNTRIREYLMVYYSVTGTPDLTTLITRYLNEQTGDMNARYQKLIQDATDAMP